MRTIDTGVASSDRIHAIEAAYQGRKAAHCRADLDTLASEWSRVCARAGWDAPILWASVVDAYYGACAELGVCPAVVL